MTSQSRRLEDPRPLNAVALSIPGLSAATRDALLAHAVLHELARGDVVPSLTDVMLDGVVGVVDAASDGRPLVSALFHDGDLIDLRRERRRPQGEAKALAPTRLISLDAEHVDDVIADHADLSAFWIDQLREQFGALRDHCADLCCKTPIERLAAALLELKRWPENTPPREGLAEIGGGVLLRLPILRADLAGYIGVKPETVSRVFRQLEREHLIEIERRDVIRLTDLGAIRRIANGGRPRSPTR